MARPTKDPATSQGYRLNVRLTGEQGRQLEDNAAAAGLTVSDYVRGLVVKAKPRRKTATPEQQEAIRALGQLGHIRADINQLVKDRQAHHFVKPEAVEAALQSITYLADQLLKLSGNGD